MRNLLLGLVMAGISGVAMAAGDGNDSDYAAGLFYAVDFGGSGNSQTLGLRLDNGFAGGRSGPALLEARFGGQAMPTVSLQGVPFAGPAMAAGQNQGGFFSGLSVMQIVALGFTVAVFGVVVAEAVQGDEPTADDGLTGGGG